MTMKILFVPLHFGYLWRYYDTTLRTLAARGHEVLVAVNFDRGGRSLTNPDEDLPGVRFIGVLPSRDEWWGRVVAGLRGTMDFVRFLDSRLAHAHALRARIKRKVLPRWLHPLDRIGAIGAATTRRLINVLAALEDAIPTLPTLDALLQDVRPDAVVLTPLVDAASPQVDLVRSARKAGTPVAVAVASWDNLTNKGLLRVEPDRLIVWNDVQKVEAVELQWIPVGKVVVTGAQVFDRWFGRAPAQSAEAFRRRVGLPASKPFVLFTGSSTFIAQGQTEVAFVEAWIRALRASADRRVASAAILVRPHPFTVETWMSVDVSRFEDVAVWPDRPFSAVDDAARFDYFDSLYHSAAVVGINTSAMIEAAILGRPVLSVTPPEFAGSQEGTLHFQHLLPQNGGFLRVAASLDEHVAQLAGALEAPDAVREQTRRFVARYVRPHGLATEVTPLVSDAFEQVGRVKAAPRRPPLVSYPLRPVAWTLAATVAASSETRDAWHLARKRLRLRIHRARKTLARRARAS